MSRILLIGSGGREHAILDALEHSKSVQKLFISPGNGLTLSAASKAQKVSIPLQPETNFKEMLEWAVENGINLVVPGPEIPLVDGIHDAFKKVGISCFGPSKAAAQLEGSKAFSKDFMARHYIPTAAYQVFTDFEKAKKFVQDFHGPLVIKASGLAAGKGVILPETKQEAIKGLESIMLNSEFGSAGDQVVIEERLEGQEVSCLAFCDGYTVVPMPGAQDHKRVGNGDTGLNTGGMGAYAPAPCYTPELADIVKRTVLQATVDAMRREGNPFIGVLYAGIMLTPAGPKVLEFNVRFGDPETQVILPLLDMSSPGASDLGQILSASARGCLDSVAVAWKNSFACTVVAASQGYPAAYEKGHEISIPASFDAALSSSDSSGKAKKELGEQITVFHAGTSITTEGKLVTSGGRVLSVTGVSSTLPRAIQLANSGLSLIKFKGMHFRTDIGYRALAYLESVQKAGTTYADAGVSIDAGNLLVEKIKPFVKATMRSGADAELGGFGGVFDLKAAGYTDPILISGTDGVGTKLKIAQHVGKHDTIGIDLVAMSVNDVLVQGAEPLYFLDYFASSKLEVDVAADVVKGIARGCLESGCALIGGETAEMPGIYQAGEYDLAGFVVGAVERSEILPRMDLIKDGDVLLGLASSGVHSNGYSLVRHVVKKSGLEFSAPCPFETLDKNSTLGEALLTPTRLYVKPLLPVIRKGLIKSMVHITGGGFIDNIPRSIPPHLGVSVTAGTWPFLPVFQWIKKAGGVVNMEMARTFNCGIGMVLVVDAGNVAEITKMMEAAAGEKVYEIGKVVDLKKNDGLLVKMNDMDSKW